MAVSAAVSVGSFSVVLAQSFAAVAASSLVPATFLTLVRAAKGVTTGGGSALASTETTSSINDMLGSDKLSKALNEAAKAVTDIDLLVPKTAKITADFEFEATDAVSASASVGGLVKVVSVSAGFSALYTSTSKNKIHLEVDFVSVNYVIDP
ncbi:hypothetical protein [Sandarakinorhabdus sp.]|uniref:hypothetical protein n=1 Tax=Sandarakinorhabdus sp. TaxID=1916663 RepID=UPI003F72D4CC